MESDRLARWHRRSHSAVANHQSTTTLPYWLAGIATQADRKLRSVSHNRVQNTSNRAALTSIARAWPVPATGSATTTTIPSLLDGFG